MSESTTLTIHIDGAARGNPGPAAYAFVIECDGAPPIEEGRCLGHTTNNVAEYTALVRVLERAAELGPRRLVILSDSELLVKQMTGEYRVKNPDLRVLYDQAQALIDRFDAVHLRHVRREENSRADQLCNEALDGGRRPAPVKAAARPGPTRVDAAQAEALTCLEAAAVAWARGNPRDPDPAVVWEQLWSVLEDHGVIRKPR
jgi:ribonuclease HI